MISEEETKKAYDAASDEVKSYLDSDALFAAFNEIRTTHTMHFDHAGNMALAIDAVVLGLRTLDDFPELMKEAMPGVDPAVVTTVVHEVNEKVFKTFREMTAARAKSAAVVESPTVQRSVIEQKLGVIAPTTLAAPPTPNAQPTPKYHGTDPYREMPE